MNFAILCAIVFLVLIVAANLSSLLKWLMVAMLVYSVYVIATHLGVVSDLVPSELDPVRDWAAQTWERIRGL